MQTLKSHPLSLQRLCEKRWDVLKYKFKDGPAWHPLQGLTLSSSCAPWLQSCLWAPAMLQWALGVSAQVLFVCPSEVCWLREGTFLFPSQPASGLILHGFANRFGSSCFARMPGRLQRWDINDGTVRHNAWAVREIHAWLTCERFEALHCLSVRF